MSMATTSSSSSSSATPRARHETHSDTCGVCNENSGQLEVWGGMLWENEHFVLRHAPPPFGVAGWLTLQAKRHVAHFGHFSDEELTCFGPTIRWLCNITQHVTKCERVYVAALGEMHPHFHMHIVPRYTTTTSATEGEVLVKGWGVFTLPADVAAGRFVVETAKVESLLRELAPLLAAGVK